MDESWILDAQSAFSSKVISDELTGWRALKSLTTGEARKVVTSLKTENRFRALRKNSTLGLGPLALHVRLGV